MRSCSSSVLAHESAEQVAPVDLGRRIFATEGRFDSGIRRLQPEGPVWAMGVVVLDVDPQHLIKQARQLDELGRAGSYASTRALASRNSSSESPDSCSRESRFRSTMVSVFGPGSIADSGALAVMSAEAEPS